MAKGVGLIGNFKGKVGNTVGYSLKDSNNKQTQGIRVYQPVVRNPKTYAQAEQRAKLAPINATYRALKMVIDRGQEGLAYGNKSRLAWLSEAIKKFTGGYFEKGAAITAPALVPLTKGSLAPIITSLELNSTVTMSLATEESIPNPTIGDISTLILAQYPQVKAGDQITFIAMASKNGNIVSGIDSFVINTEDNTALSSKYAWDGEVFEYVGIADTQIAGAIILSREGENGTHLRSTTSIMATAEYPATIRTDAAKEAAIVSYMSQGANTDWAEESLMQ